MEQVIDDLQPPAEAVGRHFSRLRGVCLSYAALFNSILHHHHGCQKTRSLLSFCGSIVSRTNHTIISYIIIDLVYIQISERVF